MPDPITTSQHPRSHRDYKPIRPPMAQYAHALAECYELLINGLPAIEPTAEPGAITTPTPTKENP